MRSLSAICVYICSLVPAAAGQASGVYEDPAGDFRIVVELEDPLGPIGLEHFEAVKFRKRSSSRLVGQSEADQQLLALSTDSIAALRARGALRIRQAKPDEGGVPQVDWSGVTARIEVQQITACTAGLAGEISGLVTLDQSFLVQVQTAMSQLSVLSTLNKKGDADLYVYDAVGAPVCSSTFETASKIADQCGYLDGACNQSATSWTEVYGFKKKNSFHLAVWFVNGV